MLGDLARALRALSEPLEAQRAADARSPARRTNRFRSHPCKKPTGWAARAWWNSARSPATSMPSSSFPCLDLERLTWAWRAVIDRHPMLRAVVEPDGTQRILAEVPPFTIAFADYCEAP